MNDNDIGCVGDGDGRTVARKVARLVKGTTFMISGEVIDMRDTTNEFES